MFSFFLKRVLNNVAQLDHIDYHPAQEDDVGACAKGGCKCRPGPRSA